MSPDDIPNAKISSIPEAVYEVINDLITRNWAGNQSKVYKKDIIAEICFRNSAMDRATITKFGWLNFEDAYRARGWNVKYDSPGCDESYDPHFIFTRKGYVH